MPGRHFLKVSFQVVAPLSVCSLFRKFICFNDANFLLISSTSTSPTLPSTADSSPTPYSLTPSSNWHVWKVLGYVGSGSKMFAGEREHPIKILKTGDEGKEDPRITWRSIALGKRKRGEIIDMKTFGNRKLLACFHFLSLSSA